MDIGRVFNALIDIDKLTNIKMLYSHIIYIDDFIKLDKTRQVEIYEFCKCHTNNEYCSENLKQIMYAVSQMYFGF
jgi:hypothetical protein